MEPYLNKDTIETTGAGDTFGACALHAVLKNGLDNMTEENLKAMLQFANVAASLITTKKGALKVMPEEKRNQRINKQKIKVGITIAVYISEKKMKGENKK